MRSVRVRCGFGAALAAAAVLVAQAPAIVRVTTDRANIRSSAAATAPVLVQVPAGTYLNVVTEEGAWFQVQLPPNPRMPGIRMVGYVSKTVATVVTGVEAVKGAEAASRPIVKPRGDTITVGADHGGKTTWLKAAAVEGVPVVEAATSADAIAASGALQAALGGFGARPFAGRDVPAPAGADQVTWVWVTAASAAPVLTSRRPSFFVSYGEVGGLNSNEWVPAVVRLLPIGDSWRFVSALAGPANARLRGDADWAVRRGLVQRESRASLTALTQGIVRMTPDAPLEPGEYAVVIRPFFAERRYEGRSLLGDEGPGVALGAAWVFVVR